MIDAGINLFVVEADQAAWIRALPVFHVGLGAKDLRYPVDFLCYTPEEFRRLSRRGGIVREALREGVHIPP